MNYNILPLCAAVAFIATGSGARAETRDFGSAGDYEVFGEASTRDETGGCMAEFEYEGPGSTKTKLFRTISSDDKHLIFLTVVNHEWSAEKGKTYELTYIFGDSFYERESLGVKSDVIYKGFMSAFPADEFLRVFAGSKSLHIHLGDTVVDKLLLSGSAAGVALFNKCWAWVVGTERAAQAERDKYKTIPRDPFAQGAAAEKDD